MGTKYCYIVSHMWLSDAEWPPEVYLEEADAIDKVIKSRGAKYDRAELIGAADPMEPASSAWLNGEAPMQCTGKCFIGGVTEATCTTCGWSQKSRYEQ